MVCALSIRPAICTGIAAGTAASLYVRQVSRQDLRISLALGVAVGGIVTFSVIAIQLLLKAVKSCIDSKKKKSDPIDPPKPAIVTASQIPPGSSTQSSQSNAPASPIPPASTQSQTENTPLYPLLNPSTPPSQTRQQASKTTPEKTETGRDSIQQPLHHLKIAHPKRPTPAITNLEAEKKQSSEEDRMLWKKYEDSLQTYNKKFSPPETREAERGLRDAAVLFVVDFLKTHLPEITDYKALKMLKRRNLGYQEEVLKDSSQDSPYVQDYRTHIILNCKSLQIVGEKVL